MVSLQIQNITVEELKSLIRDIVAAEITQALNSSNSPPKEEQLLSLQEAAAYLHISTPTLMKMVKEKQIKGVRVNKRLKFKKSNLNI